MRCRALVVSMAIALMVAPAAAQTARVQSTSTPDVALSGRAGAGTALSSGTGAIFSAPAMLGASRGWQVNVPGAFGSHFQSGPITAQSVRQAGGGWSAQEREGWLDELAGGPFAFGADASIASFALQVGGFGLSMQHTVLADLVLPADAVELALFGNAGRDGVARNFDLAGGYAGGAAFTTVRLAHGRAVYARDDMTVYAGVAFDARAIHAIASLPATEGSVTASPELGANVRFAGRLVEPGGGLSAAMQFRFTPSVAVVTPQWRATASVEGAFATSPTLAGKVEQGYLDVELTEDTREANSFSSAGTDADRRALEGLITAGRRVRVGGAYRAHDRLWVVADVASGSREIGQVRESGMQASAGVEARAVGPIQLRGGVSLFDGAMGYRGGLGLGLGPITMDLAYGRTPGLGQEMLAFGLRVGARQGTLFADAR